MRSADLSGAGAERFGAGKGATSKIRNERHRGLDAFTSLRLKLSPITITVMLTTL